MAQEYNREHGASSTSTPKSPRNRSEEKEIIDRSSINDIMRCVQPVFILENFFGIFRFNVTESGFKPVATTSKMFGMLIATVIIATIVISKLIGTPFILLTLIAIFKQEAVKYGVVAIVNEIPPVIVMIQYISAVVTSLFFLDDQTIQIFQKIVELDVNLRLNIKENFYSACRTRTIIGLIVILIIHSILSSFDLSIDATYQADRIFTNVLYLQQDLEISIFCKMIIMLRDRLQVVNEYLEIFVQQKELNKTPVFLVTESVSVQNKQFNFIGRISSTNMKIKELASMYDTIGNTCYMINEVFKFQIFMNLAFTFGFIIITIWTSLYYVRTPESGAVALMTAASWCVLTILSVAVMSFTCESLLSARNNTKLFVNEIIMDYDLPRTMRLQAKVFMELIEAWPLRIFVYDMFSVDIKLMLKFVSVATTYLIVIIQISHFV